MCLCFMVCGTRQARHHKLVERGQKTAAGTEKRNYDSTYELQEVQAQTRAIARRYRNNTCMDCHTQIFIRNPNIDGGKTLHDRNVRDDGHDDDDDDDDDVDDDKRSNFPSVSGVPSSSVGCRHRRSSSNPP